MPAVAHRPVQQHVADERPGPVHVALQGPHREHGARQGVRRVRARHQAPRPHTHVRDFSMIFASCHLSVISTTIRISSYFHHY